MDDELEPSSQHGVSTVVCGNCGVGFAPVRPERREWIMGLMEGVEDIPGGALAEGLDWSWESFPEFLDALEGIPRMIDVGVLLAHGPTRAYVMGERGEANEPPSPDDIAGMARIVDEALEAGALGFSTSRTTLHKTVAGEPVPGTWADWDELSGITDPLGRLGVGTVELVTAGAAGEDLNAPRSEMQLVRRLARRTGRPISFGTAQAHVSPDQWRDVYRDVDDAARRGDELYPQVLGRAQTVLIGHQTLHPFRFRPTYLDLVQLPLRERVRQLRRPDVKARILSEESLPPPPGDAMASLFRYPPRRLFPLGDPPDYEPDPASSVGARAERLGRDPLEVLYDILLERDGRELVMYVLMNYAAGDLSAVHEMLLNPRSIAGLSDGGAHYAHVSDGSAPTYMLTHWGRDRRRGPRSAARTDRAETDLSSRSRLRPERPGPAVHRHACRREHHRLRRPERALSGDGVRPARRRRAPHPRRNGVRGEHRGGTGHSGRGTTHRGPTRRAGSASSREDLMYPALTERGPSFMSLRPIEPPDRSSRSV